MQERAAVLREVMAATGTSQSSLARMSGVRQPSISQFLSGRTSFSEDMLARLLACMGHRSETVRVVEPVEFSRSDRLRWALHRRLAEDLDAESLVLWLPVIDRNLERLARGVQGEPHTGNLRVWERLIREHDVRGLRDAMVGVDERSQQLREVSPFAGVLPQDARAEVIRRLAA